ncbi:PLC-like phosphodiesterase [Pleurotus eryngii]|uniref:PLC-like phosphodiesterase n=1 Tax=Pleurotus eryngii TaxID=5323 RepID=A0A9P6DKU2_PLEER|nr:PLC-like phosphodiesterase [Pleurotus eryngii]
MHFQIHNLTSQSIACIHDQQRGEKPLVLPAQARRETDSALFGRSKLLLAPYDESGKLSTMNWGIDPETFVLHMSMALSASWQPLRVAGNCPWRVYCSKVSSKLKRILIFPHRDLAKFLAEMPDEGRLSSLTLPGTHDSMAFYGWPISQCQSLSTPLKVQLESGIRVIDVRLAIVDGHLISYHGIYPQKTPFQDILKTIHGFFASSPKETIVMSIKQEDYAHTPAPEFSALVHKEIFDGPGGEEMWFFENRVPKLGEVRGKVVLLSRFGGNGDGWENGLEGLGIHPTTWPDSDKSGFTWNCKETLVRTHDWYNIPSFLAIPEKVTLSTQVLLPPANNPPMPVLNVTYLSAASFPLAFPPTVALGFGWPKWGLGVEGVNSRVGKWLLDQLGGQVVQVDTLQEKEESQVDGRLDEPCIRGWVFMDYYSEPEHAVVPLLVECNYRGRREGEEGW